MGRHHLDLRGTPSNLIPIAVFPHNDFVEIFRFDFRHWVLRVRYYYHSVPVHQRFRTKVRFTRFRPKLNRGRWIESWTLGDRENFGLGAPF
jgi:hypothetical protein